MKTSLPQSVRTALWSYDTDKIDTTRDKNRIITQTLNHGTADAVAWLKTTYTNDELVSAFEQSSTGEWTKKSLNYWSLLLGTKPKRTGRFS